MSEEFKIKLKKLENLYENVISNYYKKSCQCAFPRWKQIVGIDCCESNDSYRSFDTDLLINMSKPYFNIFPSVLSNERSNEKWVCKKCSSSFEYGWSDFSISVDRQKLTLVNSNVKEIGKKVVKPIPLFLGLWGHSYPSKTEITPVSFIKFKRYMLESNLILF